MKLSLEDPLFRVYAIAATIMALKMASQSWVTIIRMIRVNGGFRSPEDAKPSPFNKHPRPGQCDPNDYVDRSRRIHANDTENIPLFLALGLLFVIAGPPLWLAKLVLFGYVISRFAHTFVYITAQLHDFRAMTWTPGSIALFFMGGYTLVQTF